METGFVAQARATARTALGLPNSLCHLCVCPRGATGNSLEFLPYASLKGGGLQVQRQLPPRRTSFDTSDDFFDPFRERAFFRNDFRARIFVTQFVRQHCTRIAQIDRGYAAVGSRHQHFSQARFRRRVFDAHSFSSLLISRGRHAQLCVAALIDPACRAIACCVECVRNAVAFPQKLFEFFQSQCRREFLGLSPVCWRNARRRTSVRTPSLPARTATLTGSSRSLSKTCAARCTIKVLMGISWGLQRRQGR